MTVNTLAIGEINGQVVISLPEAATEIVLDPETARKAGEALAKEAYNIHYGSAPEDKSTLKDNIRTTLIQRITHVIRSLQEQKRPPEYVSSQVVDTILAEIL